jgi:4-hydroxybenzoate polyprenyltransferase
VRSSTSEDPAVEPAAVEAAPAGSPPPAAVRLAGALRLVHPFPSILDGLVVALIGLVAGGTPAVAIGLGASMTLLQFAIGALNDVIDAPRDMGRKGGKPIPSRFVGLSAAKAVAIACAAAGLAFALVGGPPLVVLAVIVLAIGVAYDLRAKGTTLSWLPLAVGIPLLPVYGWFGVTGSLPAVFVVLIPAAANAGTALAIANAIVDMERDEAAGSSSIALALGPGRAAAVVLALQGVVAALALGTAAVLGAPTGWVAAVLLAASAPLGGAVLGLVASRRAGPTLRELAWEIQAVGTGLLAVAWLGALSASAG